MEEIFNIIGIIAVVFACIIGFGIGIDTYCKRSLRAKIVTLLWMVFVVLVLGLGGIIGLGIYAINQPSEPTQQFFVVPGPGHYSVPFEQVHHPTPHENII